MISLISFAAKWRNGLLVALGGIAMIAAGATYWSWGPPRLNVVLITLDTTRADHLGAYGYQGGLTKAFDEFAKRGVIFDRAYAPTPLTLPSHATMLTGLYPPEHGLRMNGVGRLDNRIPLLTEILKKQGYATGAFIAAAVLGAQYGLDRGFDTYDDQLPNKKGGNHFGEPRRDGKEILDSALAWLRQPRSRPFFCWIHLYDAHGPYDARPDIFGQTFSNRPYDAGIAREVQQIERLTAYLKEQQLDAKTLVVIVADHGEGLDEHLESEHGMLVYNTTLHVPFAIVAPRDCQPATRVADVVSLVDLTPTVLDLLNIPALKQTSGQSLRPALNGQPIESRSCYAETYVPFNYSHWSPLQAIISDRWKYIQTSRPELYDLATDPGELTNLAASNREQCEQMRNLLEILQESFVPATAQNLKLSEKDLAHLKALGYVSGGGSVGDSHVPKDAEALPDVKDMLPSLVKFDKARHLSMQGKVDDAITVLHGIPQITKDFSIAGVLLGECLAQAGRMEEAVSTYHSVLTERPDFVGAHFSLGRVLSGQGRFEEAVTQFREFLKQNKDAANGYFELGQALANLQKYDEAIAAYREALRIAPEYVGANISLGQLLASLRQLKEAVFCFEQAMKYDPDSAPAYAHLFLVLAQMGQAEKAIFYGKRAVALEPNSFETRFNLGILFVMQKRYPEGLFELRAAQQLRPDDPRPTRAIHEVEAALKRPG